MRESEQPYRPHLFTVWLWHEQVGANQVEWRGQVLYVGDGERRAFRAWPDLIAFFEAKLQDDARHDPESA